MFQDQDMEFQTWSLTLSTLKDVNWAWEPGALTEADWAEHQAESTMHAEQDVLSSAP
jgi:hypothetical protein